MASKIDAEFWTQLEPKYRKLKDGQRYWDQEKPILQQILTAVEEAISIQYQIESPINIGGAGIVIKVWDKNLELPRALKCARPVHGKELLLNDTLAQEISSLQQSAHPNIVSIYHQGRVDLLSHKWPFYVMEYLDKAVDGYDYIVDNKPSSKRLIKVLLQCLYGIKSLHDNSMVHLDVKLENLLVLPDETAKISDLGSARRMGPEEEVLQVSITKPYAHPEVREKATTSAVTDPNRLKVPLRRCDLKFSFDLYALGQNIFRILEMYDVADEDIMPLYHRNYLALVAARLLDGKNGADECALHLPKSAIIEIKYEFIDSVIADMEKLIGTQDVRAHVPEMAANGPRTIQAGSNGSFPFSKRLSDLVSHPFIRRLASVTQLGAISQVYPSASHTRLEHVLGTLSNIVRYCDALWNDPINPLFKQVVSSKEIGLVLLGAICHDIGHYPLAHDLEEAEPQLFSHEDIGMKLITHASGAHVNELREQFTANWGVAPDEVKALLEAKVTDLSKPLVLRLLHSLLDGPIDADKLDYLIRDSNNLSLPYAKCIDVERLLRCLTVIYEEDNISTFIALGIHEKGKIPAEAVAFARYAMFGAVYWHHTIRSLKSMLHHAVWSMLPTEGDRRSREYTQLKDDLFRYVLERCGVIPSGQADLFQDPKELPTKTPQISMSDFDMLSWLYLRTNGSGKSLLKMICERQLFKRLLVISGMRSHALWKKLVEFRDGAKWSEMLRFQSRVQESLVKSLDSIDDEDRISTMLDRTKTDEIVGLAHGGEIIFLVDIPTERRMSTFELQVLGESRFPSPGHTLRKESINEDSPIWSGLSSDFLRSVGKVRVFCHPDYVETCSAALTRAKIEGALKEALLYMSGSE